MKGYEIHTIAGLPSEAFEALAKSGAISQADIARATAMRAGRAAKRHDAGGPVDIRKSSAEPKEVQVETPMQKIERAQGYAMVLADSIAAYAKMHNCSRAVAMEKVLASPQVSEYHRLDRDLRDAERELQKLQGRTTLPRVDVSRPAKTPTPVKPTESGRVSPDVAPAATRPDGSKTADEILQQLADLQQHKNPAMARAQAIMLAANSKEFSAAHQRDKVAKGL
jgi:hypothetical protein